LDDVGWVSHDYWASLSFNEAHLLRNWLHQVEPLGIGACNLQECLLWQLYYHPEHKNHPAQPLLVSILNTKKLIKANTIKTANIYNKLSNPAYVNV
jgi:DNA-directed RNA polymerase specialized sigma54-like protein